MLVFCTSLSQEPTHITGLFYPLALWRRGEEPKPRLLLNDQMGFKVNYVVKRLGSLFYSSFRQNLLPLEGIELRVS